MTAQCSRVPTPRRASRPEAFDAKFRADVAKFQQVVREAQIPKQ
jgi:hypothetical protein